MEPFVSTEKLQQQNRLDERVRFRNGRNEEELIVTIDGDLAASIKFTPRNMVVCDVDGKLIGFYDCPPSAIKEAVLGYYEQHYCG